MPRFSTITKSIIFRVVLISIITFLVCEYVVHWWAVLLCDWSQLDSVDGAQSTKVLLLADPHLLGNRLGHWFDKLRREWQMWQSFYWLSVMLQPHVIVILGDLFDEGKWSTREELLEFKDRFKRIFPSNTEHMRILAFGNHDLGFHYAMHPARVDWFNSEFGSSGAALHEYQGNLFVVLNSMALEKDNCDICHETELQLKTINRTLACLKENSGKSNNPNSSNNQFGTAQCHKLIEKGLKYSRPILLQHFPLHRASDESCPNTGDAMPEPSKMSKIRPNYDCLSLESTKFLIKTIQPRIAFDGHSHFGCEIDWGMHLKGLVEYTVASFSWRNINQPTVRLLTVTPDQWAVNTCYLARESTVFMMYSLLVICVFVTFCRRIWFWKRSRGLKLS